MATEQLLLTAVGTVDNWTLTAGSTKVVACQTPDDDSTTYISSGTTASIVQMFTLEDPGDIGAGDSITDVAVRVRDVRGGAPGPSFVVRITTSGGTSDSATQTAGAAYADYTANFATAPGGGSWSLSLLNELQAGIAKTSGTRTMHCTTV